MTEDRAAALAELIILCEPYAEPALGTRGAYQVETAKIVGAISASGQGNATVIVTAVAMANSPKTLNVAVANNDTSYQVAIKIKAALAADTSIGGFFDISGSGVDVILTAKSYAANDATMNISVDNGTCEGLTAAPTSTSTVAGSLPDLTEVEAILDNNLLATTWQASTVYALGKHVYPTLRNDRKYVVDKAGTSGATEPSWPTSISGKVENGTVTFQEDGVEFESGYNVYQAAQDAWNAKCAKASQFMSTPGLNMSSIYDRCKEMRDSFQQVCIA